MRAAWRLANATVPPPAPGSEAVMPKHNITPLQWLQELEVMLVNNYDIVDLDVR